MTSYRKLAIIIMALIILLLSPYLLPKDKKATKKPPSKSESLFRVPVDVVVLNVTATDKEGNSVTDLTANDFKAYDNGKPQKIQTFALESYGSAETEESEKASASRKSAIARNASEGPRLISIFIDDLTMYTGSDFTRMFDDIRKFVQIDLAPDDQVCIISGSGQVQFPFSNNKQQILDQLTLASKKLNYLHVFRYMTDFLAWTLSLEDWQIDSSAWTDVFGRYLEIPMDAIEESRINAGMGPTRTAKSSMAKQLEADAEAQNAILLSKTHQLLQALRQHVRALRHFEGPKMIIFFSDGFISYTSITYELQEIIDIAMHSGIVLNCSNIVGVPTYMDIIIGNVINPDNYKSPDVVDRGSSLTNYSARTIDRREQERPLAQMACDTGGMFFTLSNDIYKQFRKIKENKFYRYIMSYGVSDLKSDGSKHTIKLEVARPGVELSYRKGYYTIKEEMVSESSRKEDIVEALHGPGNMNQIPMTLGYYYFQEDDSTYAVSFLTDVNIRKIQFIDEDARRRNRISLVLAAFDETDHYINGLEKTIDFRLQEKSYAALKDHGLTSRVELKLPIGRYKIKAVVRESTQGKMGSITKEVEIP
jgi:VWFA-related protein